MGDPDMEQVAEEGAPQRRALKTFFGNITEKNVRQLRILNLEALPVQYSDKFYRDIVKDEDNPICKFIFHSDVVVGAVCARRETLNGETCVYIMTLSVLKAYRNRGLGSKMLQLVIDQCKTWGDIAYIYLHVQVSNLVALKFYQQKFGFEITETLENYYKRIEPAECHILKLKIAK